MTTIMVTPDRKMAWFSIAKDMQAAGVPVAFAVAAVEGALRLESVGDLMQVWAEEPDANERGEIIADIQDLLDDLAHAASDDVKRGVYVHFDDLDAIAQDIRAFKNSLREVVEQHGGISRLAELTGIPQPSLSRFFNSVAMPRMSTLAKMANALKLRSILVNPIWVRD